MIIDAHAHMTAPDSYYAWKASLLAARGSHGGKPPVISDDALIESYHAPHPSFGHASHMQHIDGFELIDLMLGQIAADQALDVDITWRDPAGEIHRETLRLKPGWHKVRVRYTGTSLVLPAAGSDRLYVKR